MKMQKAAVSQALVDTCAFAVVRVPTVERGIEIAEGLAEGGYHAMDSYTSAKRMRLLLQLESRLGDKMIVGRQSLWSQQRLVLLSWLALSSLCC